MQSTPSSRRKTIRKVTVSPPQARPQREHSLSDGDDDENAADRDEGIHQSGRRQRGIDDNNADVRIDSCEVDAGTVLQFLHISRKSLLEACRRTGKGLVVTRRIESALDKDNRWVEENDVIAAVDDEDVLDTTTLEVLIDDDRVLGLVGDVEAETVGVDVLRLRANQLRDETSSPLRRRFIRFDAKTVARGMERAYCKKAASALLAMKRKSNSDGSSSRTESNHSTLSTSARHSARKRRKIMDTDSSYCYNYDSVEDDNGTSDDSEEEEEEPEEAPATREEAQTLEEGDNDEKDGNDDFSASEASSDWSEDEELEDDVRQAGGKDGIKKEMEELKK